VCLVLSRALLRSSGLVLSFRPSHLSLVGGLGGFSGFVVGCLACSIVFVVFPVGMGCWVAGCDSVASVFGYSRFSRHWSCCLYCLVCAVCALLCVRSVGYMRDIFTCGLRLSLPRFQPWENRAWWWSRFKEPLSPDSIFSMYLRPP